MLLHIFLAEFILLSIFPVHSFSSFGNFDFDIYNSRNLGQGRSTASTQHNCPTSQGGNLDFWQHGYHWVNDIGCVTHTGADFQVGSNPSHVKIKSYGFGKVLSCRNGNRNTFAFISIQNLLNSGDSATFNLLHFYEDSVLVNSNQYISKYQHIGNEGNTGLNRRNRDDYTHLHLEISNLVTARWVSDANACPGNGCSIRNMINDKDSLHGFYNINRPNHVWYDPATANNYQALIPYISLTDNLTQDNYSVFAYIGCDLYGLLSFRRSATPQSFNKIGIFVRRCQNVLSPNRYEYCDDSECFPTENDRWIFFNENINIPISENYPLSGNTNHLDTGAYLLYASVKENHDQNSVRGYPILIEVLNENNIIVDNDQSDHDNSYYNSTNEDTTIQTIPGYYLKAELLTGNSNTITSWCPQRYGRFQIWVHIPRNVPDATQVRYKIVTKNSDNEIFISEPISQNSPGWHQLFSKTGDKTTDNWFFNNESRISLHLNTISSYQDSQWANVGVNRSNANILHTQKVAIDAVKFIGGETNALNDKSYIDIINEKLVTKGIENSYLIARKIYKNFMELSEIIIIENNNYSITSTHDNNVSKYFYIEKDTNNIDIEEEILSIDHKKGTVKIKGFFDKGSIVSSEEGVEVFNKSSIGSSKYSKSDTKGKKEKKVSFC